VLVFAIIGTTLLFTSRAATPFASLEPEQGTTTAGVTIGTDSNASGGQFVQLGEQSNAINPLSVYRGAGRPDFVAGFESWFGNEIPRALDFYPGESWAAMQGNDWQLNPWSKSRYDMTFSISMLPSDGSATLAAGARGDYNLYWQNIAKKLVSYNLGDSNLRIGFEFNGNWFVWAAEKDPASWPVYYRNIVTSMRSVEGANFKFDWNPTNGTTSYDAELAYPGDAYVDIVGVNVYNSGYTTGWEDPIVRWNEILNNRRGLAYWIKFAKDRNKPLSLPEWGTGLRSDGHGGGDDPYFIEKMFAVISDPQNNIAYHNYWDYCAADFCGRLSDGTSPNAGAKFKELFGSLFSP